jgi:hypothetical protein
VAFLYAFFLYRKDVLLEEVSTRLKWVLAGFRFLSVSAIFILLIGIILEQFAERKERPLLFIANDNSASVLLSDDSTFYKQEWKKQLTDFEEKLESEFEVVTYDFDDVLTPGISTDYSGKSTDISNVFNQIFDQYTNRNIGGIVLISDGLYNQGSNPLYAISRKSFLPVFTVGMGDTTEVRDVRVEAVRHNDIAFLGNEFPVEVTISQTMCAGESAQVGIYSGDNLLTQKQVKFEQEFDQKTVVFQLKASQKGFVKYRVVVSSLDNEYSLKNNEANFYVEVIDGRQKILIAHSGPHPDIASLQYVIGKNKNYEVEVKPIKEVESASPYDLLILHNYVNENPALDQVLKEGGTPALFIIGTQTNLPATQSIGIGFSGRQSDYESVNFAHNSNFKEILLSPNTIRLLTQAPPLEVPFGSFQYSGALDVLAYQKVGNITLEQPLIYFTQKQNSRYGVIMGEGIWRWRLFDQLKNKNTRQFEELIGKTITYLAVKENKDPFKISIDNEYTENDPVKIGAKLYNQSYDLINDPEVAFVYANEAGKEFESYFVRTADAYQLDLGTLPQGVYTWNASTTFQGKQYEKSGTFLVREIKIEFLNPVADHRVLRSMAKQSGGSFFFPKELPNLETELIEREDMVTVVYQEKEFNDLIDYKWIFFLIVLLLGVEWFVRKYNGAY